MLCSLGYYSKFIVIKHLQQSLTLKKHSTDVTFFSVPSTLMSLSFHVTIMIFIPAEMALGVKGQRQSRAWNSGLSTTLLLAGDPCGCNDHSSTCTFSLCCLVGRSMASMGKGIFCGYLESAVISLTSLQL